LKENNNNYLFQALIWNLNLLYVTLTEGLFFTGLSSSTDEDLSRYLTM
jgi:hypothetical protein